MSHYKIFKRHAYPYMSLFFSLIISFMLLQSILFHHSLFFFLHFFAVIFLLFDSGFHKKPMLCSLVNISFLKPMLTLRLLTSVVSTSVNNRCWKSLITNVKSLFSSDDNYALSLASLKWNPLRCYPISTQD